MRAGSPTATPSTMRFPWQRLRADRPPSTTVVLLLLALVLAFLTSSTLVGFHQGWQPWPSVTGGVFFPALSVLLVVPNPARYRVVGLSMRQWMLDHGLLVGVVAVVHLAWPVWATVRPVEVADRVPGWTPLLPAVAMAVTVALVLHHHRHALAGRATGTGDRVAGTPLHYRAFLARRGPVAWRAVYQPVGLTALVAVVLVEIWQLYGENTVDPQAVTGSLLFAAVITAPVVAASRQTAVAVGLPRRVWVAHVIAAVAVPLAGVGAPVTYRMAEANPDVPVDAVRFVLYLGIVVTSALVAAGLCASVSYEDWGTTVMWLIGFGFLQALVGGFGFNTSDVLWPNLIAVAGNALLAWCLLSYVRGKAVLGQPDWAMTSIIRGAPAKR
ncbi:hypothetical protein PQI66_11075 [Corynebacterium sp. USCH3]|uniref:hypothetical protein n=1 Tax=Corynebacterium sp. USCH3 TaxID=3024840 RepID=UPI0030AC6B00